MLRASLVLSTIIISALSAAATVFMLVPKVSDAPEPVAVQSSPQSPARDNSTAIVTERVNPSENDVPNVEIELQELHQKLEDANAERAQLAETVVSLNRQIAELESDLLNLASLASQQSANTEATATTQTIPQSGNGGRFGFADEPAAATRYESLLAAGVDANSAQDITDRQNSYQLERLELRDLATREGWFGSDQYRQRTEELAADRVDLREELGEDTYDAYLYNAGSSNRVLVESIIPGSAADAAGAQTGDMIMTYADSRIYQVRDLQQATRGGSRGELVDMTIDRQGQFIVLSVPRGPLGVTLEALRIEP